MKTSTFQMRATALQSAQNITIVALITLMCVAMEEGQLRAVVQGDVMTQWTVLSLASAIMLARISAIAAKIMIQFVQVTVINLFISKSHLICFVSKKNYFEVMIQSEKKGL